MPENSELNEILRLVTFVPRLSERMADRWKLTCNHR